MGNTIKGAINAINSAVGDSKQDQTDKLNALVEALENKVKLFELEIDTKRGKEAATSGGEVAGGRSVMRVSEIRVSDGQGMDSQITAAVVNFFNAVTNSNEDDPEKQSAIAGATNLVQTGLNSLFGTTSGQAASRRSWMVLFINNAFCRIDYYAYSYNVDASMWGQASSTSGACYVADISVLTTSELEPSEIDYFLSQALSVGNGELDAVNRLKMALIQSAILSRALGQEGLTFEDLGKIAEQLAAAQKAIDTAFNSLNDFVLPQNTGSANIPQLIETKTRSQRVQTPISPENMLVEGTNKTPKKVGKN